MSFYLLAAIHSAMSSLLEQNKEYAEKLKTILKLRYEPVAIKLIREGEEFPAGLKRPDQQYSHCQALFQALNGACLAMHPEDEACHVGGSALGMMPTPEKVSSGAHHFSVGMHDTQEATAVMEAARMVVPFKTIGEAVCPLKDADFVPDTVSIVDIPERAYWVIPLETAVHGGRFQISTAPFQCTCEDVTAIPICTGKPNMSMGCFGCRRKTAMKPDEMVVGIPYARIPSYVEHLDRYVTGPLTKAKRD